MHARVGDEVVRATPGCRVLKPRRIPHTMWNAGPEPARLIELYTPGGFELFFKDFGDRLRHRRVAQARVGVTNPSVAGRRRQRPDPVLALSGRRARPALPEDRWQVGTRQRETQGLGLWILVLALPLAALAVATATGVPVLR
jgi:hypothetical protein